MGTDEEVFYKILAHNSFSQLKLMFEEYKDISGKTIEQALKSELDGELLDAMLAIGESFFRSDEKLRPSSSTIHQNLDRVIFFQLNVSKVLQHSSRVVCTIQSPAWEQTIPIWSEL